MYHLHVITLITLLHGWCLEIIFFLVKQLRKKKQFYSIYIRYYTPLQVFTPLQTSVYVALGEEYFFN